MRRRAFAESLVLGAMAPLVGWAPPSRTPAAPDATPTPRAVSPPPDGRAAALAELVRLEHGDHLTSDDLLAITREIQAGLDRAEVLWRAELRARRPAGAVPRA